MAVVPASRKAHATHARLVDGARRTVRRDGVLSPETAAGAAGVSPATLYTYFGSKHALLAAAFDVALEEIGLAIAEILTVERLLVEGWDELSQRLVLAVTNGFSHDGRLISLALADLHDSTEVVEVYSRRRAEQLKTMARFIRLGVSAGRLPVDDPEVMARVLMIVLQGLHNPLVLSPGSDRVVREMVGVVRRLFGETRI
ncbi:MAG: TetR/AcrR family transcriptional regulator [Actinomycetota bacterium]